MTPVLAGFIGYLLVVVVVGFLTFRLTRTLADFLLAGRRLGAWVVAFSGSSNEDTVSARPKASGLTLVTSIPCGAS